MLALRPVQALRPLLPVAAVAAAVIAGAIAGVVGLRGVERLDVAVVVLPIAAGAAWWLVNRPVACVTALVGTTVLFEDDALGFLDVTTNWYRTFFGLVNLTDLLLGLTVAAVVLDHVRRPQGLRVPRPFVIPLLLLLGAVIAGLATGLSAGADMTLLVNAAVVFGYLLLIPFAVAHVVTTPDRLRQAAVLIGGIGILKAAIGIAGVALGQGRGVDAAAGSGAGGAVLTYYGPLANMLTLLVALTALALVVARLPSSALLRWGAVLCALSLALSYRRSFWIAAAVAAALVLIVASGRRGRLLVVLAGVLVAGGLQLVLTSGDATEGSVITQRVRSINREDIEANVVDRYRLEEQANVLGEISRRPLTGIGLGRPWAARHPLSIENEGGRNYVHTIVLWYWLKLGPLGVLAYVALHATAAVTALRLWRRGRDPLVRAVGIAAAAGIVGIALAETTGSFTGVEDRFTVFIAATYGWLAAATTVVSSGADALEERVRS